MLRRLKMKQDSSSEDSPRQDSPRQDGAKAFDEFRAILLPWLGDARTSHPDDLYFSVVLSGCGFRRLTWRIDPTTPDWVKKARLAKTGMICPRCQMEIRALLKSHVIEQWFRDKIVAFAPQIFCRCVPALPFAPAFFVGARILHRALVYGPGIPRFSCGDG